MFKEMLSQGKKEQKALANMSRQVKLLCTACEVFRDALKMQDGRLMLTIIDLEREGDMIRRQIMSNINEGAFMPYLRPNLYRFVETTDEVLDLLEDAALLYQDIDLIETVRDDCIHIAAINVEMSEMLLLTFESMLKGDDLREQTLAIRIYEKRVDDIKFILARNLKTIEVKSFWEGKSLSDFISSLVSVSDVIEDASDALDIINVSMK